MSKNYYDILGIPKNTSPTEIKKTYRKLAMLHHPDKGGDSDRFKDINEAYETLSDPMKKKKYDSPNVGHSKFNFPDIFNNFMNINRHRKRLNKLSFQVSLEDIYSGISKKIQITRNISCIICKGKGGDKTKCCNNCDGNGYVFITLQNSPTFRQTIQTKCDNCNAKGYKIIEKCRACNGSCNIKDKKIVDLHIKKGAKNGDQFLFEKYGDELINEQPADLIIILVEKNHPIFKRNGNDLYITKDISLYDALVGFNYTITHLDKRILNLTSDKVIKNSDVEIIKGEGITSIGDLHIKFNVIFPLQLINEKVLLQHILK